MPRCAVPGCRRRNTSTHYFPKDVERCTQWVKFVQKYKSDFRLTPWVSICGAHFEMKCFNYNFVIEERLGCKSIRRNLTEDAVPTIANPELAHTLTESPRVTSAPSTPAQSSSFTTLQPSLKIVTRFTQPSNSSTSSASQTDPTTKTASENKSASLPEKGSSTVKVTSAIGPKPVVVGKLFQKVVGTTRPIRIAAGKKTVHLNSTLTGTVVGSSKQDSSKGPVIMIPKSAVATIGGSNPTSTVRLTVPIRQKLVWSPAGTAPLSRKTEPLPPIPVILTKENVPVPKESAVKLLGSQPFAAKNSYTLAEVKCMNREKLLKVFSFKVKVVDSDHSALRCRMGDGCPFVISCPSEHDCESVMNLHLRNHIHCFVKCAEEKKLPDNRVLIKVQNQGGVKSIKVHGNNAITCNRSIPYMPSFLKTRDNGRKEPPPITREYVTSPQVKILMDKVRTLPISKEKADDLCDRIEALGHQIFPRREIGVVPNDSLEKAFKQLTETIVSKVDKVKTVAVSAKETQSKPKDDNEKTQGPSKSLIPESKRKVVIDPNLSQSVRTMNLVLSPLARFSDPPRISLRGNPPKADDPDMPVITHVRGSVPRGEAGFAEPVCDSWNTIDRNYPNILGHVNSIIKSYSSTLPSSARPTPTTALNVSSKMSEKAKNFFNNRKETENPVSKKQFLKSVQNSETSLQTAADEAPYLERTTDDLERKDSTSELPDNSTKAAISLPTISVKLTDSARHNKCELGGPHLEIASPDEEPALFFDDCDFDVQQNVELPAEECELDVPEVPLVDCSHGLVSGEPKQYYSMSDEAYAKKFSDVRSTVIPVCAKKEAFLAQLGLQRVELDKIPETQVISNDVSGPKFRTSMQKNAAVLQRFYYKCHAAMTPKQLKINLQPANICQIAENDQNIASKDTRDFFIRQGDHRFLLKLSGKMNPQNDFLDVKDYHLRRANQLRKRAHEQTKVLNIPKDLPKPQKIIPDTEARIVRMPEDGMLELYKEEQRMIKELEEQETERKRMKLEKSRMKKMRKQEEEKRKKLEDEMKEWEMKDNIPVEELLPPGKVIFQRAAVSLPMRKLSTSDEKSPKKSPAAVREIVVNGQAVKIKQEPPSDGEGGWMDDESDTVQSNSSRCFSEDGEEQVRKEPELSVSHLLFQRRKQIKKPSDLVNMLAPPDADDHFFDNIFGEDPDTTDSERNGESEIESSEGSDEEEVASDSKVKMEPQLDVRAFEISKEADNIPGPQVYDDELKHVGLSHDHPYSNTEHHISATGTAQKHSNAVEFEAVTRVLTKNELKNREKALVYLARIKVLEMRRSDVISRGGVWKDKGEYLSCKLCSKQFATMSTVYYHYRSHAGLKPYKCETCLKSFTRLNSLRYHKMVHDNKMKYTCRYCGKGFRHPSHFKEHLNKHTGEEPFKCRECVRRFKTSNSLRRHLRGVHGLKTKVVISEHMPDDRESNDGRERHTPPPEPLPSAPLAPDLPASQPLPLMSRSPPLPDSPPAASSNAKPLNFSHQRPITLTLFPRNGISRVRFVDDINGDEKR